jgi:hypothetical protein
MAVEKLKEVPQELWLGTKGYSKGGVCFYMSEYVELNVWASVTYADAKTAAEKSTPSTIMKSGKAKNLADRDRKKMNLQWANYRDQTLDQMTVYRIAFWFGAAASAPAEDANPLVGRNHAAVVAAGDTGTVLFFEPNFGFYEAIEAGTVRAALLESSINDLYAANGNVARNFIYLKGKKLKAS